MIRRQSTIRRANEPRGRLTVSDGCGYWTAAPGQRGLATRVRTLACARRLLANGLISQDNFDKAAPLLPEGNA